MLAVYMTLYIPIRALRRFVSVLLAMSPSPTASSLAYRPGAVCQVALHGLSLKKSAFAAHQLKLRNADVVGKCLGASHGALLAGVTFVMGIVVSTVAFALHVFNPYDVHLALVPAAAAAAAAAVIFAVFFTAYVEAIETILQCFCEDLERNDGSALRQYYMPAGPSTSTRMFTYSTYKADQVRYMRVITNWW